MKKAIIVITIVFLITVLTPLISIFNTDQNNEGTTKVEETTQVEDNNNELITIFDSPTP